MRSQALAICNACFAPDCEIIGLDPNGRCVAIETASNS